MRFHGPRRDHFKNGEKCGLVALAHPVRRGRRAGHVRTGVAGNLGDPAVSTRVSRRPRIEAPGQFRRGAGNSNSRLPRDEQKSVVPPGERKGAGRDGRREVGAL
jgi:hypothetical protein